MDCPKCTYKNTPGSLYCQLCYEVLSKSASRSYIHAGRQNPRHRNPIEDFEEPIKSEKKPEPVQYTIHWGVIIKQISRFLSQNRKGLWLGAATAVSLALVTFISLRMTRLQLFGMSLNYHLSKEERISYLIGFRHDITMWSQYQGRMDTPFPKMDVDETGTVQLSAHASQKSFQPYKVEASQWIKTSRLPTGPKTEQIEMQHDSLLPATVIVDKRGILLDRRHILSARLGRSTSFLMPRFPKGTLRPNKTWNEKVEWIDAVGEWKIYWHGTLEWKFIDYIEENQHYIAKLVYTASLIPSLWEAPSWAGTSHARLLFSGDAGGDAIWDMDRHVLSRNNFHYKGQVHIPIPSLKKIPWTHRVGRLMATGPGEVILDMTEQIDVRKL